MNIQIFLEDLQTKYNEITLNNLINGKNISDAAAQLFIHRNTLIYRIGQMEKILNIDFKTANENTLFYLYISCIIAEWLFQKEA